MSGEMLVTFGALANAAQSISSTHASLNQKLDDLHSLLTPIVNDWTGQASENYQVQQQKWNQAQTDLNTVLQSIGSAVEAAHDAYTQTENANAQSWGS